MGDFKIIRIRHYKWFLEFIWWCIKDMCHPVECYKFGLIQENWEDFNTRLYFDANPKGVAAIKELEQKFKEISAAYEVIFLYFFSFLFIWISIYVCHGVVGKSYINCS